jgi:hypothetical protein
MENHATVPGTRIAPTATEDGALPLLYGKERDLPGPLRLGGRPCEHEREGRISPRGKRGIRELRSGLVHDVT